MGALESAIDDKADSVHTHVISEVDNLQTTLDTLQENIDSIPQSDWNQNDEDAEDYIKNRPFYEEAIDYNTTLVDNLVSTDGEWNQQPACTFIVGHIYDVIWNGELYADLICQEIGSYRVLGNPDELPFYIDDGVGDSLYIESREDDTNNYTVSIIYRNGIIIHTIDPKYIKYVYDNVAGRKVTGETFIVDETEVEAAKGAEIFNDYDNNIATGILSHAEGNKTVATGIASHSEGFVTTASGDYGSHAEGNKTFASGYSSHVEGQGGIASGAKSHAEGDYTTASGEASHAEGYYTTASGEASHAEGASAVASGYASHAEGSGTTASGSCSHAEGRSTIAASDYQHVQGKYNVADVDSDGNALNTYAHIVGNGTWDARSNAHTLDWNGNAWYAGSVEGTALILSSPNGTRFNITIGDDGVLTATEIVEETTES